MAASCVSVSQAGYNTTMDILGCGTPAVVVPYGEGREDEQAASARRLERLGALRVLDPDLLSGPTLVDAVRDALTWTPALRPAVPRRPHPHVEAAADPASGARRGDARDRDRLAGPAPRRSRRSRGAGVVLLPRRRRRLGRPRPRGVAGRLRDLTACRWTSRRSLEAVTERTAELVTGRQTSGRNDLRVHQHGFAHVNHEPEGRKCEFGVNRSPQRQREDISRGRDLLRGWFGDVPSVFTPPWNRCAPWTAGGAARPRLRGPVARPVRRPGRGPRPGSSCRSRSTGSPSAGRSRWTAPPGASCLLTRPAGPVRSG